MADYYAPLQQMRFTIEHLVGFDEVKALPDYEAVDADTVEAVLEEAAKFASGVLAPINWLGDRQGVRVVDDAVQVPAEFTDAYAKFCEGGWPGIAGNPDFGGQGLPKAVAVACDEMWAAANVSFALCPELSQGAILAMDRHATDELKAIYLEKLISGQWAGTMCLTEAQAGSDLSSLTTRAEPKGDRYLITGQKIYITWGDHPMAENIIHLVLARLPDAPPGVRGISLFLVPKYKVNADGSIGARERQPPGVGRAQDGHTREPDLRARVRRQRRRGRIPGRQAERRTRRDVHDDELHASRRRRAGRRSRGPFLPAVGDVRARAHPGPRAGRERPGRDHPAPRRAAHAAHDALAHPGEPSRLLLHGRVPRPCRARSGRRGRGLLPGASRPADAGRQGLVHRGRARDDEPRHPDPWRHGLRRGDGHRAVLPRRAHRADLRRHQCDPGDRPRRPQAAARRWCDRVGLRLRHARGGCAACECRRRHGRRAQRARPRARRPRAVFHQHPGRRKARPGTGGGGGLRLHDADRHGHRWLAAGARSARRARAARGRWRQGVLRDAGGDGAVLRRARAAAHHAATRPRSAPAAARRWR